MLSTNELASGRVRTVLIVITTGILLFSAYALADNARKSRERQAAWDQVRNMETKAARIDLSRTDLAAISAAYYSEPNRFHSILNAFDNNSNWINNINYTNWPGGTPEPWVEVQFDTPVVVTQVEVQSNRQFATTLMFSDGSRRYYPYSLAEETIMEDTRVHMTPPSPQTRKSETYEVKALVPLPEPGLNVVAIRLNFENSQGLIGHESMKVRDIRVLGIVPPGTTYKITQPRIAITREKALKTATDSYYAWQTAVHKGRAYCPVGSETEPDIVETANFFTITMRSIYGERRPVFRTTIDKKTGNIESAPVT